MEPCFLLLLEDGPGLRRLFFYCYDHIQNQLMQSAFELHSTVQFWYSALFQPYRIVPRIPSTVVSLVHGWFASGGQLRSLPPSIDQIIDSQSTRLEPPRISNAETVEDAVVISQGRVDPIESTIATRVSGS